MNASMHVAEYDQGDVIGFVDWEGFDAEERTWESLRKIHSSAPDFVLKELRKLRLTRALKGKLASEYGISFPWRSPSVAAEEVTVIAPPPAAA